MTNNKAFALQVAETGPMAPPLDGAGSTGSRCSGDRGSPASVTEGKVAGMLAGANVHLPQAMVELNNVVATM